MTKYELQSRTKAFAINVFHFAEALPKSKASDVIIYQLLRSASSVAANYRACNRAKSRNDFSNKLKIVLEEIDESNFWLSFIEDLKLTSDSNTCKNLIHESHELTAIFASAAKTTSNLKS